MWGSLGFKLSTPNLERRGQSRGQGTLPAFLMAPSLVLCSNIGRFSPLSVSLCLCEPHPSLILFLETITTVRKIEGGFRCRNKKLVFGGEPGIGVGVGGRPFLGDFPRMALPAPPPLMVTGFLQESAPPPPPPPLHISRAHPPACSAEVLQHENAEC